jgi:hypothetical protein
VKRYARLQELREDYVCSRESTRSGCLSVKLDDCPGGLKEFSKCKGTGVTGIVCCEAGTACIEKNNKYAQCRRPGFKRSGWTLKELDCADGEEEP